MIPPQGLLSGRRGRSQSGSARGGVEAYVDTSGEMPEEDTFWGDGGEAEKEVVVVEEEDERFVGEDTLRDQLQIMKSLRAVRRRQRAQDGKEGTDAGSAEIRGETIVVGAHRDDTGMESEPPQVIIQGRREQQPLGAAPAAARAAAATRMRLEEDVGQAQEGADEADDIVGVGRTAAGIMESNVATLAEALMQAGAGTRVLVESGALELPPSASSIDVPEAMSFRVDFPLCVVSRSLLLNVPCSPLSRANLLALWAGFEAANARARLHRVCLYVCMCVFMRLSLCVCVFVCARAWWYLIQLSSYSHLDDRDGLAR